MSLKSKDRASWDPALSDQKKPARPKLPGVLVMPHEVLELEVVPAPAGPLFYDRLILHLSDGEGGRWMLNLGEFKPSREGGALAASTAYFRVDEAHSAQALCAGFARWLGQPEPTPEEQPKTADALVPFKCLYYGLEAREDEARWEDFIFELGTAFELRLGLRLWRGAARAQFFLPDLGPGRHGALMFALSHMFWGQRLLSSREELLTQEPLVETVRPLEGPAPSSEVCICGELVWFLGAHEDGPVELWRLDVSLGQQPQQVWSSALWYIAGGFSADGKRALIVAIDEALERERCLLLSLETLIAQELTLPSLELEPGEVTATLDEHGERVAICCTSWDEPCVKVFSTRAQSGCELLGISPALEGLDGVWDWHPGRGLHAICVLKDERTLSMYWELGQPQWRGQLGQTRSPSGRWIAQAQGAQIHFSPAEDGGGEEAWRWRAGAMTDLEGLSEAMLVPAESLRWSAEALVLYASPWLLLDPVHQRERVLMSPDSPTLTFYEFVALGERCGVLSDLDGALYLATLRAQR